MADSIHPMTCRLCQEQRQLRNSHIIPEFIYGPLYDEKHRFHVLSTIPTNRGAKQQKGLRERLLCANCEKHISQFERYASMVFAGRTKVVASRDEKLIHISGLQYAAFKLFALSILWRAGVSSLSEFEQVSLGAHEIKLRAMIQDGNPGSSHQYPFFMSPVVHNGVVQTDLIMQPTWTKLDGHLAYRFVFGGISWVFVVSSHRIKKTLRAATLSENGSITMLVSEIMEMPFVTDLIQELHVAGRLPMSGEC